MDNQYNGGIQDIASMTFGTAGQSNNQNNNQNSSGNKRQKKNVSGGRIGYVIVAIIILVWMAAKISDGLSEREAKKVWEDVVEGEFKYEDCYPEEFVEALGEKTVNGEEEMTEISKELKEMKVSMVKISGKKNREWLQKIVKGNADSIGADIKEKDIKVSKGYMLLMEMDGEAGSSLVLIKVNGKYGFYQTLY